METKRATKVKIRIGIFLVIGMAFSLIILTNTFGLDLPSLRNDTRTITTISDSELFTGYQVFLTGNESRIFKDPTVIAREQNIYELNLKIKTLEERTLEECNDRGDVCLNVTYDIPDNLTVRDRGNNLIEVITLDRGANNFSYNYPRSRDYFRLGRESVVVFASYTYNSKNQNVTNEPGFAHLAIASDTSPINASNVVLYMPFDTNTSTTTAYDYTTNNYDGVIAGDTYYTPNGMIGGAYEFDSEDDYINLGDLGAIEGLPELTISLWAKTRLSASSGTDNLIEKAGGGDKTFDLTWTSSEDITFRIYNTSGTRAYGQYTNAIINEPNVWKHIVAVYNGTNALVYVDAVVGTFKQEPLTGLTRDSTHDLQISSTNTGSWNGTIDEVLILNISLTPSQVTDLFNNQSSRFFPAGKQIFLNQNVSGDGTENRLNVTLTDYQNNFGTNISITLDEGATETNLSASGIANNIEFSADPNSLNVTFIYRSNLTNPFYTPLIIGNITLESWTSAGADSCTYTSGDWNIACSDNCIVSSDVDVGGNSIYMTGTGIFKIQDNIKVKNFNYRRVDKTCYYVSYGSGGFYQ